MPFFAAAVVPFLGKSLFESTTLVAMLIAAGDMLLIVSLFLLRKPFWIRFKQRVIGLWKRARQP